MLETVHPQLADKTHCTGCGACANGCGKGAIHMLPDREGFLYPTVTDACIVCGHCTHICPVLKQREPRPEPAVFAAWSTEESARADATAGGVFTVLAEYMLEQGGVVFGAALDDDFHVRHIAVKERSELARLQGAKPVQSEIGRTYQQVRYYLDQRRPVLFTGTPCQVDGLYRYLGEHPEKLLTADVLCHGVSSPGVWDHMVRSMAYIKQKQPLSVQFVHKSIDSGERRFRVKFEGGASYDAPFAKSEFGRGFHRGLTLRPACHTCPYASTDRPGDLSLGMYKGLPRDFCPDEQKRGISLLLINTAKGAHVFDTLPLTRYRRSLSEAVAGNEALHTPSAYSAERAAFFDAFAHQPFQQVRTRFFAARPFRFMKKGSENIRKLLKNRR